MAQLKLMAIDFCGTVSKSKNSDIDIYSRIQCMKQRQHPCETTWKKSDTNEMRLNHDLRV